MKRKNFTIIELPAVSRVNRKFFTLIEPRISGTNSRFTLIELLACQGIAFRRNAKRLMRFTLIELLACLGVVFRRNTKRSVRFTLIELLVVIGIIGLLAALLFPVFSKVRMNAKKSSCLNNLHQIGIAVNAYVNEYDSHLPLCRRVPESPDDAFSVVNIIKIKSRNIYRCPADTEKKYEGDTYFGKYGTSYEWNTWLNGRKIDKTEFSMGGVLLNTPLIGDAMDFHSSLGRNYLYPTGKVQKSLKELIE